MDTKQPMDEELRKQTHTLLDFFTQPSTTKYLNDLEDDLMQLIHQYGDTREAEGRISDSHDWDVETFEPITVCRRCATTFQTRGNKPCKGKMAKIGLRAKLKKTKEEKV